MRPAIHAANISKTFGEESIFSGVELEIDPGEIAVLMGPNGVGKTILLSCITGGLKKTTGSVEVLGSAVDSVKKDISVLLQEAVAIPELSGRENIGFYSKLHPNVDDPVSYTERFELNNELDKVVRHYSGGMKQKLELSIVLGMDVSVYFLDEPTAALDLGAIRTFHDAILEKKDEGRTVLMTSHTPLDAQIADRVLFMTADGVVADGAPKEPLSDVPDTIRVRGSVQDVYLSKSEHTLGEWTFAQGDEVKAFLDNGSTASTAVTAIERTASDCIVSVEEPSYTDLFNYYSVIKPHLGDANE